MKKLQKTLKINPTWTLFLDRDGVINKKLHGDYVSDWSMFEFLPGTLEALEKLSSVFGKILLVTNQRGIGRNVMTKATLYEIHTLMLKKIEEYRGRIDAIYFCPHLEVDECKCRKPSTGMAAQAKRDFPEINFSKSIIVGDSLSDMEFGKALGMFTVFINKGADIGDFNTDAVFEDLRAFAEEFSSV